MNVPGERRIVAVRTRDVGGHTHIVAVKLVDDTMIATPEVVRQIKGHEFHYVMVPPEGSPAYEAYRQTGYPVLVQVRQCPDCTEQVIFA